MSQQAPPHGALAHFAINADDLARSQTFYEQLFGWRFHPWGPPGFLQIETPAAPSLRAALQGRRELLEGVRTVGFECTVAVDDVHRAIALAVDLGGKVVMERSRSQQCASLRSSRIPPAMSSASRTTNPRRSVSRNRGAQLWKRGGDVGTFADRHRGRVGN